jgi:rhodanese-related sulfurtransferase
MSLELTVQDLQQLLAAGAKPVIVDVREQWEFDLGHLDGSVHIPLGTLPERMQDLDRTAEIVTVCHTGRRSLQAAHFMHATGFARVRSLRGGVEAWSVQIDPSMPRY